MGSVFGSSAPWETTVAATRPGPREAYPFSLTAPVGAPNTIGIAARPSEKPWPTQAYTNQPLIESPAFASDRDGCTAYPANTFRRGQVANGEQGIAVLRYKAIGSGCRSISRTSRARTAGATAVVFVDPLPVDFYREGPFASASGASYSVLSADWSAIKATPGIDVTPTGNARATLGHPPVLMTSPNVDNIAYFSSRGPSPFMVLKPDLAAPGFDIFAAVAPASASGYDPANLAATAKKYAYMSGTSMAAPHVAGAAALVRAVNRSWTPMEIRSALMTTAVRVLDEDNLTPALPNTAGAGRIDVAKATNAGILFDETYANFLRADPDTGGKPETLNVASFYHFDCVDVCTFKRTVRSGGSPGTWTIAVQGLPPGSHTLDKTSFVLGRSNKESFALSVDTRALAKGRWFYGAMTLTSSDPAVPVARLPIAIRPATSKLRADANAIAVSVPPGGSVTRLVNVWNAGNPGLNWRLSTTRLDGVAVDRRAVSSTGLPARAEDGDDPGYYMADWFDLDAPGTRIKRLKVLGSCASIFGAKPLADCADSVRWNAMYDDGSGRPAGIPGVSGGPAPAFTFESAPVARGLSYRSGNRYGGEYVTLDVAAAGAAVPDLPPGRYWLSMSPVLGDSWTNRVQFIAAVPGKMPPARFAMVQAGVAQGPGWYATTDAALALGPSATGAAMRVDIDAACSAPWISYSTLSGNLGSGGSALVKVTFDATTLAQGTYKAYVCVSGNGTSPENEFTLDYDSKLIPVTFTVGSDSIFVNPFE